MSDTAAVDWEPIPADWSPLSHPALLLDRLTFVRSQPPETVQVRWFCEPHQQLRAQVWFGPRSQGPPGHVHGGCIAAVLDELVGGAAWLAGYPVVAATLTVRFRNMLPLYSQCWGEGQVTDSQGRRVSVQGRLVDSAGTLFAEAEGIFVALDPTRLPPMSTHDRAALDQLLARTR